MPRPPKNYAEKSAKKSISIFRHRVEKDMPASLLDGGRKKRRKYKDAAGSLGDDKARFESFKILKRLFLNNLSEKENEDRRYFLCTFCWDDGIIDIDEPHLPDIKPMKLKVYKWLQRVGLSGIGVVETAAFRESEYNTELVFAHIHAICWTTSSEFRPKKAAKRMMASGSFPNRFGAPGVDIRSRKMAANRFPSKKSDQYNHLFSDLDIDQTDESLAWLCHYLFKAPAFMKKVMPKKTNLKKTRMVVDPANYPQGLALKHEQILHELRVIDAVFSIGEGKKICSKWRAEFKGGKKQKPVALPSRRKCRKKSKRSKRKVKSRRKRLLKKLGVGSGVSY